LNIEDMPMSLKNERAAVEDFSLIDLNDLPKYSPWPARLMKLSDWALRNRNDQFVLREYSEKWGDLLQDYENHRFADLREAMEYLFRAHFPSNILFHIGEQIYYSQSNAHFWNFFYSRITEILNEYLAADDTLVELGCGWGRNLFYALQSRLCKKAIGAEYTEEGLMLGKLIGKQFGLPIDFFHFDYYNPNPNLELLQKLKGTVVFTHNSIEQITYLPEETILSLIESRPRAVIHFEPIYEYRNKNTLLHYMWKRYTEINDYNRNLLTVLKMFEEQGRLKITVEKVHSLGLNAFNPGSFIVWEPN